MSYPRLVYPMYASRVPSGEGAGEYAPDTRLVYELMGIDPTPKRLVQT